MTLVPSLKKPLEISIAYNTEYKHFILRLKMLHAVSITTPFLPPQVALQGIGLLSCALNKTHASFCIYAFVYDNPSIKDVLVLSAPADQNSVPPPDLLSKTTSFMGPSTISPNQDRLSFFRITVAFLLRGFCVMVI